KGVNLAAVVKACKSELAAVSETVFKGHRIPTHDGEGDAAMADGDDIGEVDVGVQAVYDCLVEDLNFIFGHVNTFVRGRLAREATRTAKAQELATAARTAAGDVGSSTAGAAAAADGSKDLTALIREIIRQEGQ